METINISGLNKAHVLVALFNASKPLGYGFNLNWQEPMSLEEAEKLVSSQTYFDYIRGRVMKIDLSSDELSVRLYDRDNGAGAAQAAIQSLYPTQESFEEAVADLIKEIKKASQGHDSVQKAVAMGNKEIIQMMAFYELDVMPNAKKAGLETKTLSELLGFEVSVTEKQKDEE